VVGSFVEVTVWIEVSCPVLGNMLELVAVEVSRALITVWKWVSLRVVRSVVVLVTVDWASTIGRTVMEEVTTTSNSDGRSGQSANRS
jgi:hypothetical protein